MVNHTEPTHSVDYPHVFSIFSLACMKKPKKHSSLFVPLSVTNEEGILTLPPGLEVIKPFMTVN